MKTLLLTFSLLLCALCGNAFSQSVVVTSLSQISIDGKAATDIVSASALAKSPEERDALRSAVLAYEATIKAAQDAATAEIAKATKLRAACESALAAGDLDTLKSLLQPAVDEAKLSEKERKLAELAKQAADIQAQIDALSKDAIVDPAPVVITK